MYILNRLIYSGLLCGGLHALDFVYADNLIMYIGNDTVYSYIVHTFLFVKYILFSSL